MKIMVKLVLFPILLISLTGCSKILNSTIEKDVHDDTATISTNQSKEIGEIQNDISNTLNNAVDVIFDEPTKIFMLVLRPKTDFSKNLSDNELLKTEQYRQIYLKKVGEKVLGMNKSIEKKIGSDFTISLKNYEIGKPDLFVIEDNKIVYPILNESDEIIR